MAVIPTLYLALALAGAISIAVTRLLYRNYVRPSSVLRSQGIPGPPANYADLVRANMAQVDDNDSGSQMERWREEYGPVFSISGFLRIPHLVLFDKTALSHILIAEPHQFPKPAWVKVVSADIAGHGILLAEGR